MNHSPGTVVIFRSFLPLSTVPPWIYATQDRLRTPATSLLHCGVMPSKPRVHAPALSGQSAIRGRCTVQGLVPPSVVVICIAILLSHASDQCGLRYRHDRRQSVQFETSVSDELLTCSIPSRWVCFPSCKPSITCDPTSQQRSCVLFRRASAFFHSIILTRPGFSALLCRNTASRRERHGHAQTSRAPRLCAQARCLDGRVTGSRHLCGIVCCERRIVGPCADITVRGSMQTRDSSHRRAPWFAVPPTAGTGRRQQCSCEAHVCGELGF